MCTKTHENVIRLEKVKSSFSAMQHNLESADALYEKTYFYYCLLLGIK